MRRPAHWRMHAYLQNQPTLVEQVVNAIVSEIVEGELPSNSRLIQDELARAYGVSRQPVQQALLLLRDRGLVREAPGSGLIVSPIDPDFVRNSMRCGPCWMALPGVSRPNAARPARKIEGQAYIDVAERRSRAVRCRADRSRHALPCFHQRTLRQSADRRDDSAALALSAPSDGRGFARRRTDAAGDPRGACRHPRCRKSW